MNPLGVYRPGTSVLHRCPASVKLFTLTLAGSCAIVWRTPASTTVLLAAGVVGFAIAGVGIAALWSTVRRILPVMLLIGGYQAWQQGIVAAYTIVGNIVGLVLLAGLLATVTPLDETIDVIVGALGPFRRFGVRPERVALAFSLLIRTLPDTMATARETRRAAIARSLHRNPRAHLTPLVIRTVARARSTGEALHARNLLDD